MSTSPAATAADLSALSQASQSLWLATLSLMTAFMQTPAPAHRYLLAKRIARNFATLKEQECFTQKTRASFAKLEGKWSRKVELLAPEPHAPRGVLSRLLSLLPR